MIDLDIHEIREGGRGRYFISHGEKGESELHDVVWSGGGT